MIDTLTLGHLRPDHEDCECVEQLDHDLYVCDCPGYPLRTDTPADSGQIASRDTGR